MGFWKRLFGGSVSGEPSHPQRSHTPWENQPRYLGNTDNPKCEHEGCPMHVYKQEHTLCYDHWKGAQHKIPSEARPVSPCRLRGYNRLIEMVGVGSGKGVPGIAEQDVRSILVDRHSFDGGDVDEFLASPTVRGLLQWAPPHDVEGRLHEGYEWAEHGGNNWYRTPKTGDNWTVWDS